MRILTGVAVCAVLLTGCGIVSQRALFEGQSFDAKLRKIDRQPDAFTVAVKPVSRSLTGAVQAGEYEAVQHCIKAFGNSDIAWTAGPDTPQGQLSVVKDTVVLQGQCSTKR
ncbi:MAG: hypothetical protein WBG95_07200 [Sulfitobacter sp.]